MKKDQITIIIKKKSYKKTRANMTTNLTKTQKINEAKCIYKEIRAGIRTDKLTRREAFIIRFTRWEWPLRKDGWFPKNFPPFKATPENSPHKFAKEKAKNIKEKNQTLDRYF
jgi:hypothetical protein